MHRGEQRLRDGTAIVDSIHKTWREDAKGVLSRWGNRDKLSGSITSYVLRHRVGFIYIRYKLRVPPGEGG